MRASCQENLVSRHGILVIVVCGLATALGCASKDAPESTRAMSESAAISEVDFLQANSELGPVSAEVKLSPAKPSIGDSMVLELSVTAREGVSLEMPSFKEALSRFAIEDFDESEVLGDDGELLVIHRYKLQAGASGRMRVPPMRIVFRDTRDTKEATGEERELLSDELPFEVQSVLPSDDPGSQEINPIRGELIENLGPSFVEKNAILLVVGAIVLILLGLFLVRRRIKVEVRISPYEKASVALAELESKGLPDDESRDHWYVELSGIVRHYLEDRFALRAPELTTEEFLRVAKKSDLLRADHKTLLSDFLADCDRVKFAGYAPEEAESRTLLEAARRFLLETREEASEQETGPGDGASPKASLAQESSINSSSINPSQEEAV